MRPSRSRPAARQFVTRREFNRVTRDVRRLRSLAFSFLTEDREGTYRPSFVRSVLTASDEAPTKKFRGTAAFLEEFDRV